MAIFSSTPKDLIKIAQCHKKAFSKSLSSKLGLRYCIKMLSFYIEDNRGVLFHIIEGDTVTGYCGGLMNRVPGLHGSATSVTQHTFRSLVLNILIRPWLVFHPEIRMNFPLIIKNLKLRLFGLDSRETANIQAQNKEFVPSMGLVVIGVSPDHQGKGFGSLLLREFELKAQKEGFPQMHLSVRRSNSQAIAAYKKNGWQIGKEGPEEYMMYKSLT